MTCQRHVKSLRTYRKSHKYLCILPVRFVNSHSTVIRMEKYWQLLFSSMPHRNITITKTTWNFIRTNFAIVPTFYSLPKIYKDACNPPPPGRPIIREGERLVKMLINEHLSPHVTSLQSYVKDDIHFLQIIDNLTIPENAYLVTIDVEAL